MQCGQSRALSKLRRYDRSYPVRSFLAVHNVWGTRSSMLDWVLDAGLSCAKGAWYIYDRDTGWLVLMWWEGSTGFSRMSFTPRVISSII